MKNISNIAVSLAAGGLGGLGTGACYYNLEQTNFKPISIYLANNLDDSWNKCCINNPGSVLAIFEQHPGAPIEQKFCHNTISLNLYNKTANSGKNKLY